MSRPYRRKVRGPDVSATTIFVGLACGTLLTAVGLAAWNSFPHLPVLSRAARAVGWLAGALLLIGALFAWPGSALAFRLILMAALAAPPHRRRDAPWNDVLLLLPALALAGGGLLYSLEHVQPEVGSHPATPVEIALLICGGLGARALGEALSNVAASTSPAEPSSLAYVLLTLLVGGAALASLWQRGTVWAGAANEGALAASWLAWSAARLGPRQHHRLRAGLTIVAASLLVATVMK